MTYQTINIGGVGNDGTGDTLRDAGAKINANFALLSLSSFTTKAALQAATVSSTADAVQTIGYTTAADGGGAVWKRAASEPSHDGKIQSADGAWWEISDPVLSPLHFGALRNGTTNDAPAFKSMLNAAQALGRPCYVPAGTYAIATVINPTVTANIEIEFAANARLVAGAALNNRMFFLSKTSGSFVSLRVRGGYFDGSAQPNNDGSGTTAWDIWYVGEYFDNVEFDGITVYNGADYENAGSDSGIFYAGRRVRVHNCTFTGCWDSGVYLSANASLADGEEAIFVNNNFVKCLVGIIAKRGFRRYVVTANTFDRCGTGVATGEAGTLAPGTDNIVTGNTFIQPRDSAIIARIANGTVIANNFIEDQGYDLSDAVVTAGSSAIQLQGSKHCVVQGNVIQMRRFSTPSTAHRGILLSRRTLDGTDYDSEYNLIASNVIEGVSVGIRENTSTQDYNRILFNVIRGASTRIAQNGTNTFIAEFTTDTARLDINGSLVAGGTFGTESLRVIPVAGAVDRVEIRGSASGAPQVMATGATTNCDLLLTPQGTGSVRYGTHSALSGETVTGYITIKDAGGTTRKLAVVS